jgi:hypothetical protein
MEAVPEPPRLIPLPDYGVEREGYDVSAGCIVYGMPTMTTDINTEFQRCLVKALEQRGYRVVDTTAMKTVELRAMAQKGVRLEFYSCRHQSVPSGYETVNDIGMVVAVFDRPSDVPDEEVPTRLFHVMGREQTPGSTPPYNGVTSLGAVEDAVENLFRIDAFRRALEPRT